jgi:SAM-dependent methyltransferase
MKINIGSGNTRVDGFLNIDSDPLCEPDYVINLETDTLPFDDNTIDEVRAHSILEHIGPGFFHLIKELYRVCKDGALIDIIVPHPHHEVFYGDLSHVRPITVQSLRHLSKTICNFEKESHTGWSGHANILDVDFEIVRYEYDFDEEFIKRNKNTSHEDIEWIIKSTNNAVKEIQILMMVNK